MEICFNLVTSYISTCHTRQSDLCSTEAKHWYLSWAMKAIGIMAFEGGWHILEISCQFSKLLQLFQLFFSPPLENLLHLLHHHLLFQFILLNTNGSLLTTPESITFRFKLSSEPSLYCSLSQNWTECRDLFWIGIWLKGSYCQVLSSGGGYSISADQPFCFLSIHELNGAGLNFFLEPSFKLMLAKWLVQEVLLPAYYAFIKVPSFLSLIVSSFKFKPKGIHNFF